MGDIADRFPKHRREWPAFFASLSPEDQGRLARANLKEVRDDDGLYRAWYLLCDAETRARLDSAGLTTLQDDRGRVNTHPGFDGDPADSPLARTEAAPVVDGEQLEVMERLGCSAEMAGRVLDLVEEMREREVRAGIFEGIRLIVSILLYRSNVKAALGGLVFAFKLGATNGFATQHAYARFIGLSRAAISKMTKFWQETFDLPANEFMKSPGACASYRRAALEDHFRGRTYSAKEGARMRKRERVLG